jgi:hypothetical protein
MDTEMKLFRDLLLAVSQSETKRWLELDYTLVVKKHGEYGGFTIVPVERITIDHEKKVIVLED